MPYRQNIVYRGRKNFIFTIVVVFFLILVVRLYYLQIIHYSKFVDIADANRVRVVPIEAPRGIIYDRNGKILVDNKSQYNIGIIPFEISSSENTYTILSDFLKLSKSQIQQQIERNSRGQFVPAKILRDVDFQILTQIEEHKIDLPGVLYSVEPVRSFPSSANLSQVLGYVREISDKDLKNLKKYGYRMGDLIGWTGLEREYESVLRGKRGYRYIQVDAHGREVGKLKEKNEVLPKAGNDLYLTIDIDLQTVSEKLMEGKKGVLICIDSENGGILSLVSKPDYLPDIFSGVVEPNIWNSMINNPEKPLYNRAIQGTYPPGSVFKLITAIAALENGIVDTNWSVRCSGKYRLGRRIFRCWKKYGHRSVDMHKAIVQSCNIYFYNLIRKMDIDLWAKYGKLFKFDSSTDIDLPGEVSGIVPDKDFLDKKYGDGGWTEGLKLNMVIGQGDLLITPIQMAHFVATLATRGKLVQPHLGLKYYDKDLDKFIIFSARTDSIENISSNTWGVIERGMFDVVNHRYGTGRAARLRGAKVFGKTGTAQNPHGENHSWFIGFLKNNNSSLALVILVEHGGAGGGIATYIAGKVFRYYNENFERYLIAKGS